MLEAMKMELPVRAPADGKVAVVHCRDGELVQADALLIEIGPPYKGGPYMFRDVPVGGGPVGPPSHMPST